MNDILWAINVHVRYDLWLCLTGLISVPVNFNVYGYKSGYTKAMAAKVIRNIFKSI